LTAQRHLTAAQGSYALTGENVALAVGRKIALDAGYYTLTGQDAGLEYRRLYGAGGKRKRKRTPQFIRLPMDYVVERREVISASPKIDIPLESDDDSILLAAAMRLLH
jgi:hypothetical protein